MRAFRRILFAALTSLCSMSVPAAQATSSQIGNCATAPTVRGEQSDPRSLRIQRLDALKHEAARDLELQSDLDRLAGRFARDPELQVHWRKCRPAPIVGHECGFAAANAVDPVPVS